MYTVCTYLKNQARLSWVTCTYETETNTTVVEWFFSTLFRPIMDVVSLNSSRRLRRIKICCIHWSNNLIIHYVKRVHRLRFRYICNIFFLLFLSSNNNYILWRGWQGMQQVQEKLFRNTLAWLSPLVEWSWNS